MKIELKNIKYAAFASQETSCFEGVIYIDGVRSIIVANDGHGGPNDYRDIVEGATKRLDVYAASLPAQKPFANRDFTYQPDADFVVGGLLEEWLNRRDFLKTMKKCCIIDGGKVFTLSLPWPSDATRQAVIVETLAQRFPAAKVLNTMSTDDAFKVYMGAT